MRSWAGENFTFISTNLAPPHIRWDRHASPLLRILSAAMPQFIVSTCFVAIDLAQFYCTIAKPPPSDRILHPQTSMELHVIANVRSALKEGKLVTRVPEQAELPY